jgi:surface carbohydrate biosynthesis protein (TIGR04326 family)
LALKKIIRKKKYKKINLHTSNLTLIRSVKGILQNKKISLNVYNLKKTYPSYKNNIFIFIKKLIPFYFKAHLFLLREYLSSFKLKRFSNQEFFNDNSIFFISYFLHIDEEKYKKKKFFSHQWKMIPSLIKNMGYKINWIHHHIYEQKHLHYDNLFYFKNEKHFFLKGFFSFRIFCNSLFLFNYFYFKNLYSLNIRSGIILNKNLFEIHYLIEDSWNSSFFGTHLMHNLIFIEIFRNLSNNFNLGKNAFYLQENQGWEKAFINSWRSVNKKKIIGVTPTVIKEWDLRYYENKSDLGKFSHCDKTLPDFTLVNGKRSYDQLSLNYFPKKRIVGVEAYRYLDSFIDQTKHKNHRKKKNIKKILILGEYDQKTTLTMIRALERIKTDKNIEIFFRPHPGRIIHEKYLKNIKVLSVNKKISEILNDNYEIAISAGSTSAALDVYLNDIPLIIFIEKTSLNLSPLSHHRNIKFVSDVNEIASAVAIELNCTKKRKFNSSEIFWIDKNLTRWKRFLIKVLSRKAT